VWRSDPFVIARTIKDAPTSFRNQRAFGDLMFQMDQPKLGHEAFANAIRYAPAQTAWRVRNSYARTLVQRGDVSAAAEQFRLSLAQRPDQEFERGEYCAVLLVLGRYGDAAAQADTGAVHTATPTAFRQMRAIADSAARVNAPAGTIRLGLVRGNVRADR
jgi:predicted Zn-dependent protease